MKEYIYSRNSAVLLVLVGLTVMSWFIALENSDPAHGVLISGISVLLLAFFKVRLVIQNFMEVRHAPLLLKLTTDAWVIVASAAVIICYLDLL